MKMIHNLIEEFVRAKQLELTSPKSVTDMRYFMRLIEEGLTTLYPDIEPDQLIGIQLRGLIEWWDQGKSEHRIHKATIKKALMYLKYLFRWLCNENRLTRNPTETLRYKPRARYTPTARIARADIQKLLRVTEGDMFIDKLAHVTVRLLLDTGIRAQELCSLKVADVHVLAARINLTIGKGGKTGVMGFGAHTQRALDAYLEARSGVPEQVEETLLLNTHGRCMTPRNLDRLLKAYSKKADITPVAAHQFRVTFAVEQFLGGASLIAVQTALRHSSVDMTVRYLRLAEQERQAILCAMASVVDRFDAANGA